MTYSNRKRKIHRITGMLIVILILCMVFSCTMGAAKIDFFDALLFFAGKLPFMGNFFSVDLPSTTQTILMNIRLPRVILAAVSGIGLSICGACFQGMFKNDLADPYVLGISSGGSMGATLGIVFGINVGFAGMGATTVLAFAGALGASVLVYVIARTGNRLPNTSLILSGVAVGFLLNSIVTIVMAFRRDLLEKITMWMMGSFSSAAWNQVAIVVPIVLCGTVIIFFFARALNVLSLGEETANSLGIESDLIKKILLAVCSLIVGACVSVSGIIGFVGLIVPHFTRMAIGSDHRGLLPVASILGALFLLLSDTFARCIMPFVIGSASELPVGTVTALFGAPFFIFILIRNKEKDKF